jgi:two-component system sensor histidine kinase ChiS
MLPGMSGEMLCKRIKSSLATDHLPVLALSAKQSTDTKIELYSYGADNYLTKPFDSEELRSVVRGLIDQRTKLKVRYGQGSQRNGSTRSEGMRRIDEIIRSEMANPDFGPRDLEKAIGVNRNQLQRKVKTVTGYTPVEYIRITRLEHARNLLRQGNHNVSDAAYACGFNQLAYFSKAYKAHFGVSPKEDVVRENMK